MELSLAHSYFLLGFGSPVAQAQQWAGEPAGKYCAHGGLGGVQLVLGEAQVEWTVALQGLSPPGTPTSWTQALQNAHRDWEWKAWSS